MANAKIKLNSAGVRELLLSDEVQKTCEEQAARVVGRAGAGFTYDTRKGKKRSVTQVKTETVEAYRHCLKNNTLLKAL